MVGIVCDVLLCGKFLSEQKAIAGKTCPKILINLVVVSPRKCRQYTDFCSSSAYSSTLKFEPPPPCVWLKK